MSWPYKLVGKKEHTTPEEANTAALRLHDKGYLVQKSPDRLTIKHYKWVDSNE